MSTISDAQRTLIIDALVEPKPFYAEGIWSLPNDQLNLFLYKEPWRISLSKDAASAGELENLAATFGMNSEDILDETYRKAGKLDKTDFAINLDVVRTGLLQAVHEALFGWETSPRNIQADLYKLNVYGPGSFFKAHKDTPRGDDMFGSLVLNFPIKHEGGALVLRHDGVEVKHDASKSAYTSPDQVSWVAFYSDVEHEVLPVTSGHRVTLTYNLYFQSTLEVLPIQGEPLLQAFKQLIADDTFMPDGGRLGFGLKHQYPIPVDLSRQQTHILQDVAKCLKAGDRAVFQAAEAAGFSPKLFLVYDPHGYDAYLLDCVYEGSDTTDDNWDNIFLGWLGGEKIEGDEVGQVYNDATGEWVDVPRRSHIEWVIPRNTNSRVKSQYLAYGNQASLEEIYGDLALIVTVPAKDERAA